MDSETFVDLRMLTDNSKRWLWLLFVGGRVWRAGVEHGYGLARARAVSAWDHWLDTLPPEGRGCYLTTAQMNRTLGPETADPCQVDGELPR